MAAPATIQYVQSEANGPPITVQVHMPTPRGVGSMGLGTILFLLITSPIWFPVWLPCWLIYQGAVLAARLLPLALAAVAAVVVLAVIGAGLRAVAPAPPAVSRYALAVPPVAEPRIAVPSTTLAAPKVAERAAPTEGWQVVSSPAPNVERAPAARPRVAPADKPRKTYTPEQLTNMVRAGHPPKLDVAKVETQDRDFAACTASLIVIVDAVQMRYPTKTVSRTKSLRSEMVWTNDSAVTTTCDAAANRMTIATQPYL